MGRLFYKGRKAVKTMAGENVPLTKEGKTEDTERGR